MDQIFVLGMTLQGFGWRDLLALTDRDRIALLMRCSDYNDRQNQELERARAGTR
jgi:hypothetical protein